jgi:PAS domain S-box-containing protein
MTGTLSDRPGTTDPGRLLAAIEAAAEQLELGVFAARVDVVPARLVYVSERAARMVGRPVVELIGTPPWDIMPPDDRARLRALIESRAGEAPPLYLEYSVERPDGTRMPVEVGVARVATPEGILAVGYFRDIAIRMEGIEALRRSESRFRTLVEHAPDGVVILRGRRVTFMNERAALLLGLESSAHGIGQEITSLLPPADAARAGQRIGEMMRSRGEYPPSDYQVMVDGAPRTVEIKSILIEYDGAPAVLAFARDVTEPRAMQRELLHSDRLAAVGTLAAAVAHEINNPLTYAQLSLQYVERELANSGLAPEKIEALLEHVRNARDGTERVATIVRDLRTFARADDAPPGPVDLLAVIERAIKIAENDLRHRARLDRRYQEVPPVDGNASRLEQVFLNLLINAIQALPAGDPTRDMIAVEVSAGDDDVVVVISDTGVGIPPAVRERIFDPFFTTKPVGEGTGLGLSVCRGIVENLGGSIALDGREGGGTRVTVTLPAHRAGDRPRPEPARAPAPAPAPEARRLRVLIVDDEPLVRRVLSMVLRREHEVVIAETGAEALVAIERGDLDVVLCDLMMPGMSGMDVHAEVRRRRPGFERRIVFVTGGAFVPRLAEFLDSVDNLKLLKPFDVQQVLAAVEAAANR